MHIFSSYLQFRWRVRRFQLTIETSQQAAQREHRLDWAGPTFYIQSTFKQYYKR